ncbi:outer membrane beta-barrel protein [Vibrio harveyi]|uniref:outer membrane beta-barrel protein n=1 Tax=Vibrio harveyi TaxID=669 RepID=UPI003CF91360
MNKNILVCVLSLVSASAVANEVESINKSGLGIRVGYSLVSGDISELEDTGGMTFAMDYTFENGVIVGVNYVPTLAEEKHSTIGIESSMIGVYGGYQFDSGLKLTGGLAQTRTDAYVFEYSGSQDDMHPMFGVGYQMTSSLSVDAQFTFLDVADVEGINTTLLVGYKF